MSEKEKSSRLSDVSGGEEEEEEETGESSSPPTKSLEEMPKDITELDLDDSTGVSQDLLEYVCANFPNLKSLSISPNYDDDGPTLAFQHLSFPKLESISLTCVTLTGLHFEKGNYPVLESISLDNITGEVPYVRLDLPTLKNLSAQHVTIGDASDFASSISRCTKLEYIDGYKLWGLSSASQNKLYMPNCEHLGLYRSDDLEGFELYAPKLTELNLQACYGLEHVRIVDEPFGRRVKCFCCGREESDSLVLQKCAKCRIAQYCSKECQTKHWDEHAKLCGNSIIINLVNANIDSVSMKLLKKHPRVKKICKNPEQMDSIFGF